MVTAFQYKSKVEISYDYILEKIMALQLKAGDRVVISQIAKECGVSDIPVREALRMLQREGYVTIEANRGAVINGISDGAVRNMIEIKGVLEAYATRLSADHLMEEDLEELREINRELWKMAEENDFGFLTPTGEVLSEVPKIILAERNAWRVRNGIKITVAGLCEGETYRVFDEHGEFLALAKQENGKFVIVKAFYGGVLSE